MAKKSEEQKWFEKVKAKLAKYVNNIYWDCIELPESYMSMVLIISRNEDVTKVSMGINERTVNILFETIDKKLKEAKQNCKQR